jgi:hypothetical protein
MRSRFDFQIKISNASFLSFYATYSSLDILHYCAVSRSKCNFGLKFLVMNHTVQNLLLTFPFCYSLVGPWPHIQFLDPTQSIRLLVRGINPSQELYLHTGQHKHNKCTQTSMPQVRFEPMFERAEIVHALDSEITVIGIYSFYNQ